MAHSLYSKANDLSRGHCSLFWPQSTLNGLKVVQKLLSSETLSVGTQLFLRSFPEHVNVFGTKVGHYKLKSIKERLEVCFASPDVEKALGEASTTLAQEFHIDLPRSVYCVESTEYYPFLPTGTTDVQTTVRTLGRHSQPPIATQLRRDCTVSSKYPPMYRLKLLHGPSGRHAVPLSCKRLPQGLAVWMNGQRYEPRGESLVEDVTSNMMQSNEVRLEFKAGSTGAKGGLYFAVIIEHLVSLSGKQILETCGTIDAKDVLRCITSSMSKYQDSSTSISGSSPVVKIDLLEPISLSGIFNIPVRGRNCVHRTAFDLKVFLETRPSPSDLTATTVENAWKCPICPSLCTPEMLVIDGFLVKVREYLEAVKKLDTRCIIVHPDGHWQPVASQAESYGLTPVVLIDD